LLQQYVNVVKARSFGQWVDTAGVAGLFVFCFGMLFKKSLAHAGIFMMALSFGFTLKNCWREAARDRLFALSVAFFIFLVLRTFFAAMEFNSHIPLLIEGALKLFGTGFLLVYLVAFWLHRVRGKWDLVLIVIMAGFLVQILRNVEWGNLNAMLDIFQTGMQRATFGFATNRLGLFSALLLLACLMLYQPIWGSPEIDRAWYAARIAFWAVMICLTAGCLLYSQSRSALIAAVIVIPAALAFKALVSKGIKIRRLMLTLLIAAMVGVTLHISNVTKNLEQRLAPGNYASGLSARVSLYGIAWDNFKKQPFVGRGPGSSQLMIQQAGEEYNGVKKFDHLHNVLFDMAAQIGIIGIAFIGISSFLIIRQAFRSRGTGKAKLEYILFALGSLVIMLFTGIVNQPFHSPHGVYLAGFLGGICYSSKFAEGPANSLKNPCLSAAAT
jgi:O-antigen ligase